MLAQLMSHFVACFFKNVSVAAFYTIILGYWWARQNQLPHVHADETAAVLRGQRRTKACKSAAPDGWTMHVRASTMCWNSECSGASTSCLNWQNSAKFWLMHSTKKLTVHYWHLVTSISIRCMQSTDRRWAGGRKCRNDSRSEYHRLLPPPAAKWHLHHNRWCCSGNHRAWCWKETESAKIYPRWTNASG